MPCSVRDGHFLPGSLGRLACTESSVIGMFDRRAYCVKLPGLTPGRCMCGMCQVCGLWWES